MNHKSAFCTLFLALTFACAAAFAQSGYPAKPLRWIVPFPPGGPTDVVARVIAPKLAERLSQPVLVDNRPGAASNIGMEAAARSAPDGYTILFVVPSLVLNPHLYKINFDPLADFAAVIHLTSTYYLLLAGPAFEARTVPDIVAAAKAKPGSITCALMPALPGLACELFKSLGRINLSMVPYKGSAQAINDVMGGHVSLVFEVVNTAVPHVRSGKLRAIATTTAKRGGAMPELPAIAESLPGFDLEGWQGVVMPAATPREIVQLLNREFAAVLGLAEVRQRINDAGLPVISGPADGFDRVVRRDYERLGKLIREAGIKAQ
ncbi:MAG: tripartite tricarboxylate transporter substrate binding protein [Betaproteobacteria bacterium]|nr:tripartite tricarboxylate transporter substrate binding protein [Betaproteobacteria bacterium]